MSTLHPLEFSMPYLLAYFGVKHMGTPMMADPSSAPVSGWNCFNFAWSIGQRTHGVMQRSSENHFLTESFPLLSKGTFSGLFSISPGELPIAGNIAALDSWPVS